MNSAAVKEQHASEGVEGQELTLSDLPGNIKAFWSMVSKTRSAQSIQYQCTDASSQFSSGIHIDLTINNSASMITCATQIKEGINSLYSGYEITIIDMKSAQSTLDRLFSKSNTLAKKSQQRSSIVMGVIISRGNLPKLKYLISILDSSGSDYLLQNKG